MNENNYKKEVLKNEQHAFRSNSITHLPESKKRKLPWELNNRNMPRKPRGFERMIEDSLENRRFVLNLTKHNLLDTTEICSFLKDFHQNRV